MFGSELKWTQSQSWLSNERTDTTLVQTGGILKYRAGRSECVRVIWVDEACAVCRWHQWGWNATVHQSRLCQGSRRVSHLRESWGKNKWRSGGRRWPHRWGHGQGRSKHAGLFRGRKRHRIKHEYLCVSQKYNIQFIQNWLFHRRSNSELMVSEHNVWNSYTMCMPQK